MTDNKRVPLYTRLPEIYRTKDAELPAPFELRQYLALVEEAFGHIHSNIEALYHDLFVETSADWVVPYIGDLLGTTHLSGDPWTLRADVADTIALRRRKGTLGAIELLAYNLTRWGAHCVELRENLVWNQHLNHQRPDEGGAPPYSLPSVKRQTVIRGGTVTLRDPAMLALRGTPFDPFAYTADVKPPSAGGIRYNLPNLAIFLWRLAAYRVPVSRPVFVDFANVGLVVAVRFNVNPLTRPLAPPAAQRERQPLRLFNTHRFDLFNAKREGTDKLDLSRVEFDLSLNDEVPGPILLERLTEGAAAGAPDKYFSVETYNEASATLERLDLSDVGLQLHLPESDFVGEEWPVAQTPALAWTVRGANLCAWETGLRPPLGEKEIVIDPVRGRLLIGVALAGAVGDPQPRAEALRDQLLVTYTYGAPGPVGAHPISRPRPSGRFAPSASGPNFHRVLLRQSPTGLHDALQDIHLNPAPVVIEIDDSFTHTLDLEHPSLVEETTDEGALGGPRSLMLNGPLLIRAASNQRPILELQSPLRFRPVQVVATPPTDAAEQAALDGRISNLTVRLEGLYIVRGPDFPAGEPLIARAALDRLEIIDCTLDPEGFIPFGPSPPFPPARAAVRRSMNLREPYGFDDAVEEEVFKETPDIVVHRSITGPLHIDTGYTLKLTDSVVDAGQGVGNQTPAFAISGGGNPSSDWGPPTTIAGVTIFGRTRVESITGRGGIFVHALEARDVQKGCLKFCYFSGERKPAPATGPADRLPQNHACVRGLAAPPEEPAHLQFTSEILGEPGYAQLAFATDFRVRERGPSDDQMGAYGFLLEAHKWRNLQIRFREFMPVGVRALLIPVT
ncbi:MAG TPA: hypothetical protein VFX96_02365 [Pyrinomonadaceae bacterium]|nr:hypothetical protein [Pyrinomonadaceae bacterium]